MDWWIGGLVDWWIGGLMDWWIGGLMDWWIGGLMDWWIDGLMDGKLGPGCELEHLCGGPSRVARIGQPGEATLRI